MAYIANVSDKQQTDIESAADDSSIRLAWFSMLTYAGLTRFLNAYDLQPSVATGATPPSDCKVKGTPSVVGTHNDKPYRFDNPGKP